MNHHLFSLLFNWNNNFFYIKLFLTTDLGKFENFRVQFDPNGDATKVLLRWKKPKFEVDTYIILYTEKEKTNQSNWITIELDANKTNYIVESLKPFTFYYFKLQANPLRSNESLSIYTSETLSIRTKFIGYEDTINIFMASFVTLFLIFMLFLLIVCCSCCFRCQNENDYQINIEEEEEDDDDLSEKNFHYNQPMWVYRRNTQSVEEAIYDCSIEKLYKSEPNYDVMTRLPLTTFRPKHIWVDNNH